MKDKMQGFRLFHGFKGRIRSGTQGITIYQPNQEKTFWQTVIYTCMYILICKLYQYDCCLTLPSAPWNHCAHVPSVLQAHRTLGRRSRMLGWGSLESLNLGQSSILYCDKRILELCRNCSCHISFSTKRCGGCFGFCHGAIAWCVSWFGELCQGPSWRCLGGLGPLGAAGALRGGANLGKGLRIEGLRSGMRMSS